MNRFVLALCVSFAVVCVGPALAQPPTEPDGGSKEQHWLKQFVGEWEMKSQATMAPGQPPVQCQGMLTGRMLGELWLINEMKSDVQGTVVNGVQMIGYDPVKKKYVGTWVDSMVNHLWHYEGTVDEAGKTLTLETKGPNFMAEGKMTTFKDVYEFKSADEILATSLMLGEDGQWIPFMTGTSRRKP